MPTPPSAAPALALAASNTATLGASFPVVTLPDGTQLPTGTVGALLKNISSYDQAVSDGNAAETERIEAQFREAIPLLHKLGMFRLFAVDEWVAEGREGVSAGRRKVGEIGGEMGF